MSDRNLRACRAGYEAFARRDAAAVLAFLAPDIEIRQTPLLPWGGVHHGIDGVRTFLARLTGAIDSQVEIERMVAAEDRVVMVGRTRGTVRATGRRFDIPAVHVWTLADGRAVRWEAYVDTPAMLNVLESGPGSAGEV